MSAIAKVALAAAPYAIDRPFDYRIPDEMAQQALPGVRVVAPFGAGNRPTDGIILAIAQDSRLEMTKPLTTVLDDEPVLDAGGIALALWMSRRYFCTVYECVRAMLPAGALYSLRDSYQLAGGVDREAAYEAAGRAESSVRLLNLLFSAGGSVTIGQIRAAFGTGDPAPAIRRLTERGVIAAQTAAVRGVADKTEKIISLAIPPEEALAQLAGRRKTAPLRYAVVELLAAVGSASAKEVCYFTGATSATLRGLEKSGIITAEQRELLRTVEIGKVDRAGPVTLSDQQQQAYDRLRLLLDGGTPCAALLYGVTGSGKTQVYIKLIEQALAAGKSAVVLVPEIALTPQLLRIFVSHFGDNVAILHSSLRATERYDEWKRVRAGLARVVLGTRSAVFAPVRQLGLLILDEEQEYSYKSEQSPRYHARDVAKYRCAAAGALLVLGSATPSVETMYAARSGSYQLLTLSKRFNTRALPEVLIADMKRELRDGNMSDISAPLRRGLEENLRRGEQSILFLNRRGASRMATCLSCDHVPQCPRCSVFLTYHLANKRLMCHHCGHSQRVPEACPACGGTLVYVGTGTQKVQQTLQELLPGAEVMRMDTDTTGGKQSHETMLARFEKEQIPILVGTQMVAKGLDFPNVTLVGVIAADLSLFIDDFRAGERTFSLLTQVIGRAGRGEKAGRAVIQTYTPEHEVIAFAAAQDYDGFYEQEISLRRLRNCPPYCDLFVFTASGTDESAVIRACHRLRAGLGVALEKSPWAKPYELLGPAPAVITKVNNRYRYRLTLMADNKRELRALIAYILRAAQTDKENRGVSLFADCNPNG